MLCTMLMLPSAPSREPLRLPHFADYPASNIYRGKTAPLNTKAARRILKHWSYISKSHPPSKWGLDDITEQKVNFAGHYILGTGSCGGTCEVVIVTDAKTGVFRLLPWSFKSIRGQYETRFHSFSNSNLMVLRGVLFDESGKLADLPFGDHYFLYRNNGFVHLLSVLFEPPPLALKSRIGKYVVYDNPLSRTIAGRNGIHEFKLSIAQRPFSRKAHKMGRNTDSRETIDGQDIIGVDYNRNPRNELCHFDVKVDGKSWPIPASLWRNCLDPNLGTFPGNGGFPDLPLLTANLYINGQSLTVKMHGGYGYNRYTVTWTFTPDGIDDASIDYD